MNRESVDADAVFDALSNERRRHVVSLLAERRVPVSLDEVAREVAAREADVSPDCVDEAQQRSVYVTLYQNHLPKLADLGVVRYEADERRVELAWSDQTRLLLALLDGEHGPVRRSPVAVAGRAVLVAAAMLFAGVLAGGTAVGFAAVGFSVAVAAVALDCARGRDAAGLDVRGA